MSAILLSRIDAASEIGVSPSAFDRYVAAGTMPAPRRLGGLSRFLRSEVEAAALDLPVGRDASRTAAAREAKAAK